MAFFKRIEVWVLLALSLGAAWFVLKMDSDSGGPPVAPRPDAVTAGGGDAGAPPDHPEAGNRFRVREVRVIPEEDHEIIEIEVAGKSEGDQPLDLDNGKARLVTADGSEVPPFFVPFAAPPIFPPGEESTVTLRYWQARSGEEPRSPLTLELDGEPLPLTWQDGRYQPKNPSEEVP